MNEYLPRKVKIRKFFRETPDIVNIRADFRCNHDPGQFVMVGLPGIGEAPISISSFSEKHIDLHVREVGNVTNALGKLKKNGYVFVRGPYGKGYPMQEFEELNIILIGGGCGVAPLRAVLEYIEKYRNRYNTVDLFFGYTSPGDILFRDNISKWKREHNVHMSVDKNPKQKFCYNAETGFVTDLLKKDRLPTGNTAIMICGPPIMMNISVDILKSKGFKEHQIYISTERLMDCGLGLCGHCMMHNKYTCLDGPVFRYDEIKGLGD